LKYKPMCSLDKSDYGERDIVFPEEEDESSEEEEVMTLDELNL
jgi:hypothetical protein